MHGAAFVIAVIVLAALPAAAARARALPLARSGPKADQVREEAAVERGADR